MTKLSYVKFRPSAEVFAPGDRHPRERFAVIDGEDNHGVLWEAFDDDLGRIIVRATRKQDGVSEETRISYAGCSGWRVKAELPAPPKPAPAAKK